MRNSKIISAAIAISTIVGIGAASAADLPARTYTKAPAMVVDPAYNWTGFYIGLNAGGAWGRSAIDADSGPGFGFEVPFVNAAGTRTLKPSGFVGGGQAGYNWQTGNFVFGIEGDVQYQSLRASSSVTPVVPGIGGIMDQSVRSDFLATLRPRVGVTTGPALFYVTGGLAVGTVRNFDALTGVPAVQEAALDTITHAGWTAGGGVEWGFAPNWSAKFEYLYVDLGRTSHTTPDFPGALLTGIIFNARYTEQLARVGINYRFGGPVVARY
jgi:outer membrane immunogenic protein